MRFFLPPSDWLLAPFLFFSSWNSHKNSALSVFNHPLDYCIRRFSGLTNPPFLTDTKMKILSWKTRTMAALIAIVPFIYLNSLIIWKSYREKTNEERSLVSTSSLSKGTQQPEQSQDLLYSFLCGRLNLHFPLHALLKFTFSFIVSGTKCILLYQAHKIPQSHGTYVSAQK